MDGIFSKYPFVCVYIDDVLVHSSTEKEHTSHLKIVLSEFLKHGIVISSKKTQFYRKNIEFLGVEIGNGKIKLQPHISKKVLEFNEQFDKKSLQQFLGLVNYARPFIKNLSKYTKHLYQKTNNFNPLNPEELKQIRKIKELVKILPDLRLPLDSDYLIVETDGCENGWGAVLKRKPHKYSPRNEEEVCRYSSGLFREKGLNSSIDMEILAVIYGLNSFRLFLINKNEILVRTDCEAIVSFYKNRNDKKMSRRRWIKFIDTLVNSGYNVKIEHIKGKNNNLADMLSRYIYGESKQTNTRAELSQPEPNDES